MGVSWQPVSWVCCSHSTNAQNHQDVSGGAYGTCDGGESNVLSVVTVMMCPDAGSLPHFPSLFPASGWVL